MKIPFIEKCEQCHKLSFYPRKRTLHFPFLPKPADIIHSEKKICRSCAKKAELMIRRTHKQIRPPVWFIIKFYVIKSFYIIKYYVNELGTKN
jgi:hypothetical protein